MSARIILNVVIPGHPKTWERVGWGSSGKSYDPNFKAKQDFRWQILAAAPRLKPEMFARLGVKLEIWTAKTDSWNEDADNFAKFYLDALTPPKQKKRRKSRARSAPFIISEDSIPLPAWAVWKDDCQIDKLFVNVHRSALDPRVEILVFEILPAVSEKLDRSFLDALLVDGPVAYSA